MPFFDIVNQLDHQELKNAIDQTLREIHNRYDFKGCTAEIKEEDNKLHFLSDDDYKVQALFDCFQQKVAKRGLSLKAFRIGKIEPAAGGKAKCDVKIIEGIATDQAKEIVKMIKEMKLKVQAAVQGEQLRVTGKKRDALQEVIAAVKEKDYPLPLQFVNFRD